MELGLYRMLSTISLSLMFRGDMFKGNSRNVVSLYVDFKEGVPLQVALKMGTETRLFLAANFKGRIFQRCLLISRS